MGRRIVAVVNTERWQCMAIGVTMTSLCFIKFGVDFSRPQTETGWSHCVSMSLSKPKTGCQSSCLFLFLQISRQCRRKLDWSRCKRICCCRCCQLRHSIEDVAFNQLFVSKVKSKEFSEIRATTLNI